LGDISFACANLLGEMEAFRQFFDGIDLGIQRPLLFRGGGRWGSRTAA
jgi:hypothetical protein